jgi:serine/threonine protein kinase/WD40 repeat protein
MTLAAGSTLGPYEVIELLGAGGMGEVYRARDPRLGRDVAVKVLPEDVAGDAQRLGLFEREARAVAALNHPNILTVHDVGTHDGVPYVVTELLDGEDLRELARRRSPTMKQILGYALQAARGLEAAHAKGIVHRDLKPENVFLTTDGRVKVLDFGLAKLVRREEVHTDAPTASRSTTPGQVMGTVAYMSPEQARGQPVDARSDVFSFGVVLYELLAEKHPFRRDTMTATLTAIVEEMPADLDSLNRGVPPAVSGIVRRCLEKGREERYESGHDVVVALEAVLAAPSEALSLLEVEERSPYPGLASFTERDAGVFFGREREVDDLWQRIQNRKLLAVIGPSGVGKTSFVRAGIIASRPVGWGAVHATPGSNPGLGLAQALTPDLAGDAEAIGELLAGVAEFSQTGGSERVVAAARRWRSRHVDALLVIDQFEELFTLNPPETQARMAVLLERLAFEADVHVVLSIRDDFLIRCADHEPLAPVFQSLTPLAALSRDGLRRAVVEPAKKTGYRFEDDGLVEEMVSEVEGSRGALPLLAFAVARLWEKRDRETKLLRREAYQEIAGVAGALAQHAEATMDRIGSEHQGLVREIFRNLLTAQGTRTVIDRDELLSAHPDRAAADRILRQLIDARLLTSYEVRESDAEAGDAGAESRHRIEIVHESLLKAWPRLVRWQAQDEEGAQLRDELRQAARVWDEHDRSDDRLWSGTAFREYEIWRERYTGGLTETEEAFASAMTSLAARRRRRRRVAGVGAVVLLAVLAIVFAGLWRRSVLETRRAVASKLVTMGHYALEEERTEALAFAIASLRRADTPEARRLALRALWAGPPATVLPTRPKLSSLVAYYEGFAWALAFDSDGRQLAVGHFDGRVRVFSRDGGAPVELEAFKPNSVPVVLSFSPDGRRLTGSLSDARGEVPIWKIEGGQIEQVLELGDVEQAGALFEGDGATVLAFAQQPLGEDAVPGDRTIRWIIRRQPLGDGSARHVGTVEGTRSPAPLPDLVRGLVPVGRGTAVELHRLETLGTEPGRVVARHPAPFGLTNIPAFDPSRERIALADSEGNLCVWPLDGDGSSPERCMKAPPQAFRLALPPDGSLLALAGATEGAWLWDFEGPAGVEPLRFDREGPQTNAVAFSPDGRWLATSSAGAGFDVALWPITDRYCRILSGHEGDLSKAWFGLVFAHDGSRLYTQGANDGTLLSWDLAAGAGFGPTVVFQTTRQTARALLADPQGRHLLWLGSEEDWRVPLDGTEPTRLEGFPDLPGRLSPDGHLVAWRQSGAVLVHDLESGERQELDAPGEGNIWGFPTFDPRGRLVFTRGGVVSRWDPSTRSTEILIEGLDGAAYPWSDKLYVSTGGDTTPGTRSILDLEDGSRRRIARAHQPPCLLYRNRSGSIVASAHLDGEIRVSTLFGEEAHLLLGHQGRVIGVAISPDERWIASTGEDGTIRLWPMPDLSRPPLHSLPHDELMARLEALTNLRVVPDAESYTGYEVDLTAHRGWQTVPEW